MKSTQLKEYRIIKEGCDEQSAVVNSPYAGLLRLHNPFATTKKRNQKLRMKEICIKKLNIKLRNGEIESFHAHLILDKSEGNSEIILKAFFA